METAAGLSGQIVGREQELAAIERLMVDARERFSALLLEGEAGIGKTTAFREALLMAQAGGFHVLACRPSASEATLSLAAVGDLLQAVPAKRRQALAAPQRSAIEVALLLAEPDERAVEPRAIAAALHSLVTGLAAEQPVLIALDDLQWLDPASAMIVGFVLRRLDTEPVGLLALRRVSDPARLDLRALLPPHALTWMQVGPLSLGALQHLLRERLAHTFPRSTLVRVYEASRGNPLFALEIARVLAERGQMPAGEPLPVPGDVHELVRERVAALPEGTRDLLLGAALLAHPAADTVRRALGHPLEAALDPAERAGIAALDRGTVVFAHPLHAAAVVSIATVAERRRMHQRLADVVQEFEERALHLALSTEPPEAEIARSLDEAAALASARGAPSAAAELGEHAIRLTPSDALEDHQRRVTAAARTHWAAGESRRARALAEDLVGRAPPGRERAEALVLLAEVNAERATELSHEALREAADHPALQALIHQRLAWDLSFTESLRVAQRHGRASLELAERLDDPALRAGALAVIASLRFYSGKPPLGAEEAYELATAAADPEQQLRTGLQLASTLLWSADLDRARAFLETLYEEWHERDEEAIQAILWRRSLVEFFAGRFSPAADYAERAHEIIVQYAIDDRELTPAILAVALVAAHRGDLDLAREYAQRGRRWSADLVFLGGHEGVLGLVELWSGDASEAASHFAAAEQARRTLGMREPTTFWWRADYVEALLELGRSDDAVAVLDAWERDAARVGREWALAHATRSRGLVAAAGGDIEGALSVLEHAVARHEIVGDPFGRARALLALGVVRRRARQKRPARDVIEAALAGFEAVGAGCWAGKAAAELGRVGGRPPRAEGELTPTEQRVVALATEGRSNKEIAGALFISVHTVEVHLSHAYEKLGVRSRGQLARALAAPESLAAPE